MNTIHITLFSLLRQRTTPEKIVLWLAEEEFTSALLLPFFVRLLEKRGISIEWTKKNTRSYKKLLPSLAHYPHACIVVCDDDAIYPKRWLETLYQAHKETPGCIVGHKGFILTKLSPKSLHRYAELEQELQQDITNKDTKKYTQPNIATFLEGIGGILFPPRSLPEEVHNAEVFTELSPHADDIWFNAMAILHGTPRRVCTTNPAYLPKLVSRTQAIGLARINLDEQKNDVQFKQVFDHYNLYNKIPFDV